MRASHRGVLVLFSATRIPPQQLKAALTAPHFGHAILAGVHKSAVEKQHFETTKAKGEKDPGAIVACLLCEARIENRE